MKTLFVLMLVASLVVLSAGGAHAQPFGSTASQTVTMTVPTFMLVDVTPTTINLDLQTSDFTPGQDQSQPVTDGSTQYFYVHNNGAGASITVGVQSALPQGVSLSLELTPGAGAVSLSTTAQNAVTGLPRGAGNGTATYSFSANASQAPSGQSTATVVYTMVSP